MDRLSVTDARRLLQGAIAAASAKETELQLMVGSRYHELIESADAIVSMHSTANELRVRLQRLPEKIKFIADDTPADEVGKTPATGIAGAEATPGPGDGGGGGEGSASKNGNSDAAEAPYRLILTVPPRIWSALDRHQYFDAAAALLECPAEGAVFSRAAFPPWFGEFRQYMAQFPERITSGAGRALRQRKWAAPEYAGALAALVVVGGRVGPGGGGGGRGHGGRGKGKRAAAAVSDGAGALEAFLASRAAWVARALRELPPVFPSVGDKAAVAAWAARVEGKLRVAVRALRRTVMDAHLLFIDGKLLLPATGSGSCGGGLGSGLGTPPSQVSAHASTAAPLVVAAVARLVAIERGNVHTRAAEPAGASSATAALPPAFAAPAPRAVKAAVTAWLAATVKRVLASGLAALSQAPTAGTLAAVRQGLWAEATASQPALAAGASSNGYGAAGHLAGAGSGATPASAAWTEAGGACVDGALLAAELAGAGVRLPPQPPVAPSSAAPSSAAGGMNAGAAVAAAAAGLDLWSLLFSRCFAELGEGLLRASLREVRSAAAPTRWGGRRGWGGDGVMVLRRFG